MQIRRANEEDIPDMAILWSMLVMDEDNNACPDIKRWSELQRSLIPMDIYHPYVVEDNGKIIGFGTGITAICYMTGKVYIEGGHMYVHPNHRKGLAGMKLYKMGLEVAKKAGASFFRRHVPAVNNRMVKRLTNKGHIIKEYTVDEIIGGK